MQILKFRPSNDEEANRRSSPRRSADNCVTVIDGKAYPVHNWSDGGVLVQADERLFSINAPVEITLKFRLSDKLMDISQRGYIVRKTRDRLAIRFDEVQRETARKFQRVVDDYVTREFADSQMA